MPKHPQGSRALSQDEGTFQGSVQSLLISRAPGGCSRIPDVDVVFRRHKSQQNHASCFCLLLTILGQEAGGGTRLAKAGFCSCLHSCPGPTGIHSPSLLGKCALQANSGEKKKIKQNPSEKGDSWKAAALGPRTQHTHAQYTTCSLWVFRTL